MLLKHVVRLTGDFKRWDGSFENPTETVYLVVYDKDQEVVDENAVLPVEEGKYRVDYPVSSEIKGPLFYQFAEKINESEYGLETDIKKIPTADIPEDRSTLQSLIDDFKLRMGDDVPERNVILKKAHQYSNNQIANYLTSAMNDINSGIPKTNFSIYHFGRRESPSLLVEGAMIFALIAEGVLQVRNQMDYNDSGLSIAMFNKTGMYQNWASFLLNQYMMRKKEFKTGIIPRSRNSGFLGISSEFGYRIY